MVKSHRVAVREIQVLRLNICDSHLTCTVANKCLIVRERVEVVEWNKKMVPSLPLLSCESSVSVKENPDKKKQDCLLKTFLRTLILMTQVSLYLFFFLELI